MSNMNPAQSRQWTGLWGWINIYTAKATHCLSRSRSCILASTRHTESRRSPLHLWFHSPLARAGPRVVRDVTVWRGVRLISSEKTGTVPSLHPINRFQKRSTFVTAVYSPWQCNYLNWSSVIYSLRSRGPPCFSVKRKTPAHASWNIGGD